jgi:hypothetical protein
MRRRLRVTVGTAGFVLESAASEFQFMRRGVHLP